MTNFTFKTRLRSTTTLLALILAFPIIMPQMAFADGTAECNTDGGDDTTTECGVDSETGSENATAVGNLASATGVRSTAIGSG